MQFNASLASTGSTAKHECVKSFEFQTAWIPGKGKLILFAKEHF